jgi:hypothetical protein
VIVPSHIRGIFLAARPVLSSALRGRANLDLSLRPVLFRVRVDLSLHNVHVAVRRKDVRTAAWDVTAAEMLCRDPQVRRCAVEFER